MKAIKKTRENLINVAKSICAVNISLNFEPNFLIINSSVVLTSIGRDSIGSSIISLIPSNYEWRVVFSSDVLKLYIWI